MTVDSNARLAPEVLFAFASERCGIPRRADCPDLRAQVVDLVKGLAYELDTVPIVMERPVYATPFARPAPRPDVEQPAGYLATLDAHQLATLARGRLDFDRHTEPHVVVPADDGALVLVRMADRFVVEFSRVAPPAIAAADDDSPTHSSDDGDDTADDHDGTIANPGTIHHPLASLASLPPGVVSLFGTDDVHHAEPRNLDELAEAGNAIGAAINRADLAPDAHPTLHADADRMGTLFNRAAAALMNNQQAEADALLADAARLHLLVRRSAGDPVAWLRAEIRPEGRYSVPVVFDAQPVELKDRASSRNSSPETALSMLVGELMRAIDDDRVDMLGIELVRLQSGGHLCSIVARSITEQPAADAAAVEPGS